VIASVNDCIVEFNWLNVSLQWYQVKLSVGGCICGIDMAIAPIWCDCECEWLHCWVQLVKCQLAMVPSEVECGWLHLWHRYGHCTVDFDSRHYVCMDTILGREIKSENFQYCDKRDYYYSWGINWSIHLQLVCDSSFNAHVHMKFQVQFHVFILFVWSSVTMSVTCLCEWMKYEWVLSNSHLWVNFLVNSV